ncbi:hypothetical protein [Streptomyces lomondensis]|uniref:Uncharacterized protein n=1 Tax=Streptomyces lomondensis TaxID=68229 RepID=A0ABQ2XFL3_9ACTN|nr:hypothetical protein [Streptomyces lomondensis]MCF0077540.1 signal peptide protein [Streptomyces lomondensis]GGX14444.1 hypothetical protein GCM10010383_50740 [Streptomyces lomondensis]
MSSKNSRLRVAFLALAVAVTGLTAAGPALAATPPATAPAAVTAPQEPSLPTDFVDLPTSPLRADRAHEVTLTYRNDATAARTVAPQLLVMSPDAGPFLAPSDVRVERRTGHGCWVGVPLGSQTGTLYTELTGAQRTLRAGESVTERYRVTVVNPEARGTVLPRVALYG